MREPRRSGGWISAYEPGFGVCVALALACPLMAVSPPPPQLTSQQPYQVLVVGSDATSRAEGKEKAGGGGGGCAPGRFLVPESYLGLLSTIWERSSTFRRQCARLRAEPALTVQLFVASSHSQSRGGAATLFVRLPSGLRADVHIVAGLQAAKMAELIGHELEHVIEQLDDVDLAGIARRAPATAWSSGPDTFETLRAIKTGRLVTGEFTRGPS